MPRKLIVLSGKEVIKILEKYGFLIKRSVGSHTRMTLQKVTGSFHITIPLHAELKRSTLSSIVDVLHECVDKNKIEADFYTK